MIRRILTIIFAALALGLHGQGITDSIFKLKEIEIKAYFAPQPLIYSPSSAFIVDKNLIKQQAGTSILPAINIVPGVRMEERSPGSYRLSIRGSLLRSPFGIRNVKIYMDQFPLTDASGFTYLNALDINTINAIEVLKGPDGSLFGANSGGVVLFDLFEKNTDSTNTHVSISSGSYGLFHENLILNKHENKYDLRISHGYQKSDGYRDNSAMNRNFLQVEQKYSFSERDDLKALLFYSNYGYKTPGGLTYDQMIANPRAARYSTPVMPGAIEQQARVRNEMLFGGLSNSFRISDNISHVLSVFGSRVNFGNTAIANIEDKTENTSGLRTFIEVTDKDRKPSGYRWDTGLEFQQTNAKIRNFANSGGKPDSSLGSNRLNVMQYFFFTRFYAELLTRINIEAAISLDNFQYRFGSFEESSPLTGRKFDMQVMPKVAISYKITDNLALRASASRGFSPPTIDEIRSNDNIVNTDLQPENGWNYETGVRFRERRNRFWGEALVFKYKLGNAIVRRMNPDNTEFFENVGGTDQLGFEAALNAWIVEPRETGFIRDFQLRSSYTYSDFKFHNYIQLNNDYSGNRLTGVPEQIVTSSLNVTFPAGFFLFVQHNYTSDIPLNDANTEFSDPYNLVGMRIGCNIKARKGYNMEVFVLADNMLNERYSLGNDLNAIGKRYYNPSPVRNYSAGISLTF